MKSKNKKREITKEPLNLQTLGSPIKRDDKKLMEQRYEQLMAANTLSRKNGSAIRRKKMKLKLSAENQDTGRDALRGV